MVYNGKPSTGCSICKHRRKRCDETRPLCLNCTKIGKQCPGYPDRLDLMFKNETAAVTRKAEKGRRKSPTPNSEPGPSRTAVQGSREQAQYNENHRSLTKVTPSNVSIRDNDIDTFLDAPMEIDFDITSQAGPLTGATSAITTLPTNAFEDWPGLPDPLQADLLPSLIFNPSIEEQATTFFFNHFVLTRLRQNTTRGFLDLLVPMHNVTYPGSTLSLATQALALRTVANYPSHEYLSVRAHQLYVRAMMAAQTAIEDPTRAISDDTLLAILLFTLYESVTSTGTERWSSHIRGAVSILCVRGSPQLVSAQSRSLFRATRALMLMDALQHREAIVEFPDARGWLCDQTKPEAIGTILEHSLLLPNLLNRAKCLMSQRQNTQRTAQVQGLLDEAYSLQNELFTWDLDLPPTFGHKSYVHPHTTILNAKSFNAYTTTLWEHWPGVPLHIYPDIQVATIRNNNRVSQLLCANLVLSCLQWLLPLSHYDDRRYKAAGYRIQYLVDDIVASVPFCLGFRVVEDPQGPDADLPGHAKGAKRGGGSHSLIFPLTICARMPAVSAAQRTWIRGRLQLISKRFGLKQASGEASTDGGGIQACGWATDEASTPAIVNRQDEIAEVSKFKGHET